MSKLSLYYTPDEFHIDGMPYDGIPIFVCPDSMRIEQRLHQGKGIHPLHAGIRVRITKQAVAREARVSPATLYRFPDLVQQIDEAIGTKQEEIRPSEQRRRETAATIAELERRVSALLAENLRLTRLLGPRASQPDAPIELDSERRRRRKAY